MKLKDLLRDIEYQCVNGNLDIDILDISVDSRENCRNKVFVAIKGFNNDGHDHIQEAYENGAKAVIVSKEIKHPKFLTVIKVDDTKEALALICRTFFDYPDKKLVTIGITGTKGKTTTAYYLRSILTNGGLKCGLIGTIECDDGSKTWESKNTTPSSYEIYKAMNTAISMGGKAMVMEVSSQGVMEKRVFGMDFDYGVLTNLSPDHIGANEHSSYEEYVSFKAAFLRECNTVLYNGDSKECQDLVDHYIKREFIDTGRKLITFGTEKRDQVFGYNMGRLRNKNWLGVNFFLEEKEFALCQPGLFSVYNGTCAIGVAKELGIGYEDICEAIGNCHIPGRCEQISLEDKTIIIDYAHNAVALENILKELGQYEHNRLITVFGCGGQRDPERRYQMGKVSALLSDITVVTTDNPRHEEPLRIINQIVEAIEKNHGNYQVVENRKEAIEYALEIGEKSDIILIAGKGHEKYQIIGDKTIYFDDKEIVENIIKGKSNENIYT